MIIEAQSADDSIRLLNLPMDNFQSHTKRNAELRRNECGTANSMARFRERKEPKPNFRNLSVAPCGPYFGPWLSKPQTPLETDDKQRGENTANKIFQEDIRAGEIAFKDCSARNLWLDSSKRVSVPYLTLLSVANALVTSRPA